MLFILRVDLAALFQHHGYALLYRQISNRNRVVFKAKALVAIVVGANQNPFIKFAEYPIPLLGWGWIARSVDGGSFPRRTSLGYYWDSMSL